MQYISDPMKSPNLFESFTDNNYSIAACDEESIRSPLGYTGGSMGMERVSSLGDASGLIVRQLPRYYPLAPTHRAITLRDSIVQDLADCFRLLSIQVRSAHDGTLWLLTPEQTEIQLTVWQLAQDNQLCVEATRICGDTIVFHHYARHILDAAVAAFDTTTCKTDVLGNDKRFERLLSKLAPMSTVVGRELAMEAVDIAGNMLRNDRLDSKQLGLEMLDVLTDHRKTSFEICHHVSAAILLADNKRSSKATEMARIIQRLVQGQHEDDREEEIDYDSDDEDDYGGYANGFTCKSRNLLEHHALITFGNALETLVQTSDQGVIERIRSKSLELTGEDVFGTIAENLSKSENLQAQCLGVRCLQLACTHSEQLRGEMAASGSVHTIEELLQVGIKLHSNLEVQCRHALATFGRME